MILIITGSSHTGKTLLAQRMLEKYHYPYLSVDHLKMGLIRSENTTLKPEDDDALTEYLWPIIREIIKTAVENSQNLIVEGCYIPPDWRKDFDDRYLPFIQFICLAMTEDYIEDHFDEIIGHESDIESRSIKADCSMNGLKECNRWFIDAFGSAGEKVVIIEKDFDRVITSLLEDNEIYICRIASPEEMNQKWDDEIRQHPGNENWMIWKDEAIDGFRSGRSIPYYGILGETVICEATAVLNPDLPQDGFKAGENTAELCAFRTIKAYRGMGYFSKLMVFMQKDLKQKGFTRAVVGVEPEEKRNKAIYHHWGFTEHAGTGTETYPDGTVIQVEYYGKQL